MSVILSLMLRPTGKFTLRLLIALTCLLAFATLAGRLGRLHWSADLLAYFHDLYFFLAAVVLIGLIFFKRWLWVGVAGVTLVVNGLLLLPYLPIQQTATTEQRDLRLYVYNLYYRNDDLEQVAEDIAQFDPDVVFLMEYSTAIQGRLESNLESYPYRLIEPSRRTMGVALFSRVPFEVAQMERFAATRIPIVQAAMRLEGQTVNFVGGHPWPPIGRWGQLHREQMADIAKVAAQTPHPLVVAGDFNASPWSYTVAHLSEEADVADAQRGYWLRKTWRLNPFFALPIDQVLVSDEWQVLRFDHGERGGSDHVPLVLDLKLKSN